MPVTQTVSVIVAPQSKLRRYNQAKLRRQRAAKIRLRSYYADPVAFMHDCFAWPVGEGPTPYQDEMLRELVAKGRVAGRGPHGLGKTFTEAIAVLWFGITRDAAQVDWKCITTAGAWRQLEKYLWPEIHKWAKIIKWERVGRPAFTRHELLQLNLNLKYGSATAVASDNAAYIEGAHATSVLYLFDEAKAIPLATWQAAEGAFTGTRGEAYALAMSTPGEPNGVFYEICSHNPRYAVWHPMHVTLQMAIDAGQVSGTWAEDAKRQFGAESAVYANRVLGEFHSADEDGVIPLSWIEAAVERWKDKWDEKRGCLIEGISIGPLTHVGADIARSGEDSTILALRHGCRIAELRATHHEDTMKTTGRLGGILRANAGALGIVDTDGLGAGVTDRGREQGLNIYAFHAGAKTDKRDKSKELGFINVRAAAWWNLRELLDPDSGADIELPDDPELLGDLTAPHWSVESDSRIKVESKKEIKKRLGRSTDRADAVIQSFWEDRKKRKRRMFDATDLGPDPYPHGTGPEVLVSSAA